LYVFQDGRHIENESEKKVFSIPSYLKHKIGNSCIVLRFWILKQNGRQSAILDQISTNIEHGLDIGPIHFHTQLEASQSIRSKGGHGLLLRACTRLAHAHIRPSQFIK
jgi:hypothetical protein